MHFNFDLPFREPVLVFIIILLIILLTPLVLRKLNIPGIVGLIISGVVIGPFGFNLLEKNSAIELFSTIGLLYIMFIAGLEMDLNEFKKNRNKSMLFGLFTFFLPIFIGFPICYVLLGYELNASFLTASMFATHTLVAYPIVSRLGVSKNQAVAISVGGTIFTDTAVLLILAIIIGNNQGALNQEFWIRMGISFVVFLFVMFFIIPKITKWFFRKLEAEKHAHYIYVMSVLFLSAFLAQISGLEPIIGAFIAGLALNPLIPRASALLNRIEFIGNSLFIPFFLISVGMLVDVRVLFKGPMAIIVALTLTIGAIFGKWLAAFFTQKIFKYSQAQRQLIFGLSSSHAAATLAIILVGYQAHILDENILNGTIILILITCVVASFATEKAAIKLVKEGAIDTSLKETFFTENTLVGLSNESTVENLIQFTISTLQKNKQSDFYGLHVITQERENPAYLVTANKLIEKAQQCAISAEFKLHPILRYDLSIASGIINTIKERNIKHFYLGLHEKASMLDTFFGNITNELLDKCDCTIYIHSLKQSLHSCDKCVLAIPTNAELELGFSRWFNRILCFCEIIGKEFKIYSPESIEKYIKKARKLPSNIKFFRFENFDDFLGLSKNVTKNTLILINLTHKTSISYHPFMDKVPYFLNKYFKNNSFLIVYSNTPTTENLVNPYGNTSLHTNIETLTNKISTLFKND